uniref:U5 small nuclear ribonucleoprotein 200 kDa helicase n=1 Tax=Nicotiana sylvestris TaxID=4096 RepID=A0A1U7YGL2_NICSY|nr:PREDICTED: putative U5 small nuclear ribonucleoprotein 200 kDa helicase [Nicotiana sylvestris]XP_009802284.1 PREDICTED: putative U5 small nuclear ribonucleoprotein 200 kDa helicase [Nicotiana sylvestris]
MGAPLRILRVKNSFSPFCSLWFALRAIEVFSYNFCFNQQYEYGANSTSGESESLSGRIDPKTFGDRVYRCKPPEKIQKKERERPLVSEPTEKRRRIHEESVLTLETEEGGGVYQPKTKETRAAYEAMLSIIQHLLCGGQPSTL